MKIHTTIKGICLLVLGLISVTVQAQKISYTEPEHEDTKRTNFEIIGKVGGNFLVFKNNRNMNDISVYDADMKFVDRVKQTDMDDRWINVDFVAYSDFAWMIYQIQKRNIVYCMAVKIDGKGKRITEPVELDTTKIGWSANNKIYTTIFSDDKKQIMVFKINSKDSRNFKFTTLLYNSQLELKYKHRLDMPMEETNDFFTDFMLDNEGDMVFGKYIKKNGSELITDLRIVTKAASDSQFTVAGLKTKDVILDDIKLKVDNTNKRYIFSALYYKQKRGNIDGLYTAIWDKNTRAMMREQEYVFNEEMRKLAKGPESNIKTAFDDFFINNIIVRKDGGVLLFAESSYTTSRGTTFDRFGYRNFYNNPWMTPLNYYYYSPYSSPYNSFYWDRWNYGRGNNQNTRFHSENIMIFSIDAAGTLEWNNAIPKAQYDDESDALLSHFLMITGSEIQVVFNMYERRTMLLNNQSVAPDGKITRFPTLKNLDRDMDFLPRYGKQVSSKVMILPCFYRNNLTFAKIEF
ncbi:MULTISPECIES: hypothetical protein [unclassified Paraflavitalea]|uniref:hypothetical protein n=1 Tax=unclassified Paraflavitalea TaxID=2798305 RepID=UPI003D327C9E